MVTRLTAFCADKSDISLCSCDHRFIYWQLLNRLRWRSSQIARLALKAIKFGEMTSNIFQGVCTYKTQFLLIKHNFKINLCKLYD